MDRVFSPSSALRVAGFAVARERQPESRRIATVLAGTSACFLRSSWGEQRNLERIVVKKATLELWSPSSETMEAMGGVQCSHWVASHAVPESPFWPRPRSWLNRQAARFAGG